MWTEGSAQGQNVWSWVAIWIAQLIWHNWYMVKTPDERLAIWAVRVGMILNSAVISTVAYFNYFQ